jgi:hypothetical protein
MRKEIIVVFILFLIIAMFSTSILATEIETTTEPAASVETEPEASTNPTEAPTETPTEAPTEPTPAISYIIQESVRIVEVTVPVIVEKMAKPEVIIEEGANYSAYFTVLIAVLVICLGGIVYLVFKEYRGY